MGDLGWRVESDRVVARDEDADARPVFKGAELLEVLGLFEDTRGPVHELFQKVAAVTVDAHVPEGNEGLRLGAAVGDCAAGEVEGVAVAVEDDLDEIGVVELGRVGDRVGGGDHGEGGIGDEGRGEGIDEGGVDEGLVALDVNNVGGFRVRAHGLRDAVGAARMRGRGHRNLRAEGEGGVADAGVVGGDENEGELATGLHTLEDMLEQRLSGEDVEGLSGEAGGAPSSGDDSSDTG